MSAEDGELAATLDERIRDLIDERVKPLETRVEILEGRLNALGRAV